MLQSCYHHVVPLLRPYGERNAHLGTSTPKNLQISTIFHFQNCDVAKYIISKNGSDLQFRNGKPTELAIHAKDCDKCKNIKAEAPASEFEYVPINRDLLKQFNAWFAKEFPKQQFDQCIQLLIKEITFWRKEDKLKKAGKI